MCCRGRGSSRPRGGRRAARRAFVRAGGRGRCPRPSSLRSFVRSPSKIVSRSSVGMPGPVSATATSISWSSARAETSIRPSGGVNLTALERRLNPTWRTRRSSAVMVISSGSVVSESSMPPRLALSACIETAAGPRHSPRQRSRSRSWAASCSAAQQPGRVPGGAETPCPEPHPKPSRSGRRRALLVCERDVRPGPA
jgi:hypothetical protein